MFRILSDGTAVFPQRGNSPDTPAGYEATNNEFVFIPILRDCDRRSTRILGQGCCCKEVLHCDDQPITKATCRDCDG